jgi:hypothetical protein
MPHNSLKILVIAITLLSFRSIESKRFDFSYPKNSSSQISFSSEHFKDFDKEWHGSDYYYYSEGDGFICSVLYYKLNEGEKVSLLEGPRFATGGPDSSPVYPYAYFKNYSYFKSLEKNDSAWGKATDDFMFRQNDIRVERTGSLEKNMYGYCMFSDDLFVNIHLSKVNCSVADSTAMLAMLQTLTMTGKNKINMALALR